MKTSDKLHQVEPAYLKNAEYWDSLFDEQLQNAMYALINCSMAIKGKKSMKYSEMIEAICAINGPKWATYDNGKPINPSQLDSLLDVAGIKSKSIKYKSGAEKGYYGKWFSDAVTEISSPEDIPEDIINPILVKDGYEYLISPNLK